MDLIAGAQLGPYEILSRLGVGGMGEVWKARDTRLDRLVAIKTSSEAFSERFAREARAVAALNHPNICTLFDVGPDYIVMEYVEGTEITGPLSLDQALKYATQLASALEAAHRNGTTHRDLKPANILVSAAGIKLLDFGLAKVSRLPTLPDGTRPITLTEAGTIMGTAWYMSPEQALGETVDARSDMFSFGVVLYELLSGRRAFGGNSFIETMAAILRDEPSALDVPSHVRSIIHRCMRKTPEERFPSMSEVRAALEEAAGALSAQHGSHHDPSIAVLPFANMSADKENEYFSDGLAEEILNALATTPELKVIARTSSFAFRGKEQDITAIARTLRVRHILEGSVRRSGNRIRVSAQLVEANDGTHVWSERYDRDMTDVFAIQDEIAHAIAHALKVRLVKQKRTVSVEAWEHWLKGVHCRARNSPDYVLKAKEHFERALAVDANYSQAYSGIALCHYVLALMGVRAVEKMRPLAIEAAEKALAIDPSDSESHMVLAVMAGLFDYDWTTSAACFAKALAADSVSPRARFTYAAYYLVPMMRTFEATEQSRIALRSDPLSPLFHFGAIWCLYADRQYDAAISAARDAIDIEATIHLPWSALGFAQLGAGLFGDAVVSFRHNVELAPWEHRGRGCLAAALHASGNTKEARELATAFPPPQQRSLGEAIYFAVTGEVDAMFEALDGAHRRRDLYFSSLRSITVFRPYVNDPRFSSLVASTNLA